MSLATASMTRNAADSSSTTRAGNPYANLAFANAFANGSLTNSDQANLAFAQKVYGLNTSSPFASPLKPLKLAMPASAPQHNAIDRLSLLSSMDALSLAHMNHQQHTVLPSIDMLVLPNSSSQQQPDSKSDVVKVAYTSAEDLADALFPTSEERTQVNSRLDKAERHLHALAQNRKLMHHGLVDHRDQVRSLHSKSELFHEGLHDHKDHIERLVHDNANTQDRMMHAETMIKGLQKDVKALQASKHQTDALTHEVSTLKSTNATQNMEVENLAKQFEQLKKDSLIKSQKTSAAIDDLKSGLNVHKETFELQNSEMQQLKAANSSLKTAHANSKQELESLTQSHLSAQQEISGLSRALRARAQQVEVQVLQGPRKAR